MTVQNLDNHSVEVRLDTLTFLSVSVLIEVRQIAATFSVVHLSYILG